MPGVWAAKRSGKPARKRHAGTDPPERRDAAERGAGSGRTMHRGGRRLGERSGHTWTHAQCEAAQPCNTSAAVGEGADGPFWAAAAASSRRTLDAFQATAAAAPGQVAARHLATCSHAARVCSRASAPLPASGRQHRRRSVQLVSSGVRAGGGAALERRPRAPASATCSALVCLRAVRCQAQWTPLNIRSHEPRRTPRRPQVSRRRSAAVGACHRTSGPARRRERAALRTAKSSIRKLLRAARATRATESSLQTSPGRERLASRFEAHAKRAPLP